jgi:hypothetical protein
MRQVFSCHLVTCWDTSSLHYTLGAAGAFESAHSGLRVDLGEVNEVAIVGWRVADVGVGIIWDRQGRKSRG